MYDLNPKTIVSNDGNLVKESIDFLKDESLVVVETYPGVEEALLDKFKALGFTQVIDTLDLFLPEKEMTEKMQPMLSDDRVRGRLFFGEVQDFMDHEKLNEVKTNLDLSEKTLIYGFGASLLTDQGVHVFADVARWEIQVRYRSGMPNFNATNYDEDPHRKIKRGYFVEWRIADKLKVKCFDRMDYYLDASTKGEVKIVDAKSYFDGLKMVAHRPFRTVPYFQPGVWGGHWMKEKFNLPENNSNYAWSFDGVPEENSILLDFGGKLVETPAMNLIKKYPKALLGEKVYHLFGAEFPIRFDYLDTMGGQNLSLQVHPDTEQVRQEFGLAYTQSESYYLLDAGDDGTVYLGLKDNVDKDKMFKELRQAQEGEIQFPAENYVNIFPAKKHDHFLIPEGTIHCSGKNTVVLEISQTPYIFTFKLWDWDRVDLDGLPRPTHIDLGERAINMDITTDFVKENLINQSEIVFKDETSQVERTGLTKEQLIETTRITTSQQIVLDNNETVSMMNLVDGDECVIATEDTEYTIHYGETFIVPASVGEFTIKANDTVMLMRAQIR